MPSRLALSLSCNYCKRGKKVNSAERRRSQTLTVNNQRWRKWRRKKTATIFCIVSVAPTSLKRAMITANLQSFKREARRSEFEFYDFARCIIIIFKTHSNTNLKKLLPFNFHKTIFRKISQYLAWKNLYWIWCSSIKIIIFSYFDIQISTVAFSHDITWLVYRRKKWAEFLHGRVWIQKVERGYLR